MRINQPHIIVVGVGIIGASLTYHLARQKARVTLISQAPESVASPTSASFGWLTVPAELPLSYQILRQEGIADWHRLENELKPGLIVDWSGSLTWGVDAAHTERNWRNLHEAEYPVRLVEQAHIQQLEPRLIQPPTLALLAPQEGALHAGRTTTCLLEAASQAGATIRLGDPVNSLMTNGSRLTGVVTATGRMSADLVVLAAGFNSVPLCQTLEVRLPIEESPAILLAFETPRPLIKQIISSPLMEIRMASPTLILAAEAYGDDSPENNPQAIAHRTLATLKQHWYGGELLTLSKVMIGKRPIPMDGLPIIGRSPAVEGLYLTVMHAGVTLAAVVGRLAAKEILSGQDEKAFASYRPTRF